MKDPVMVPSRCRDGVWLAVSLMLLALAAPAPGAAKENKGATVRCIGSIGESISDFAVRGKILFTGGGSTLRALDLSDPAKPREIGWLRMGGRIGQIEARGPALYVTEFHIPSYVHVIDASDPARMRDCGQFDGGNRGIDINLMGDFLYVSTGGKFGSPRYAIFNMQQPLHPVEVMSESLREYARNDFATDGRRLFAMRKIAEESGDEITLAVEECTTTPTRRIGTRRFKMEDCPEAMRVDRTTGEVVLASEKTSATLRAGRLSTTGGTIWTKATLTHEERDETDTAVKGYGGNVGVPDLTGTVKAGDAHLAVEFRSPYGARELRIYDTRNPKHWAQRGAYRPSLKIDTIKIADRMVYAIGDEHVSVIDCRNPEHPVLVGECDLPDKVTVCAFEDDILYATGNEGILYAIDVSRPAAPKVRGSIELKLKEAPAAMAASGNRLFLAAGEDGLRALDIGNPAALKPAFEYATDGPCLDLATSGAFVYALTPDKLEVLDISGGGAPVLKGKIVHQPGGQDQDSGRTYFLKRLGNTLYIIARTSFGISITVNVTKVDVTNPSSPRMLEGVISQEEDAQADDTDPLNGMPPPPANATFVNGWLLGLPAYTHNTSGTWRGLVVYSLADPRRPELLDIFCGVCNSDQVMIYRDIIYKADAEGGLLLLRAVRQQ